MKNITVFGLILIAASTSSAAMSSAPWKMIARKNFVEGFCVAQNLNAQGIVIQPNRQIDQATVNAFKSAVVACKTNGRAAPAPAVPSPTVPSPAAPLPTAPAPAPVSSAAPVVPIVN